MNQRTKQAFSVFLLLTLTLNPVMTVTPCSSSAVTAWLAGQVGSISCGFETEELSNGREKTIQKIIVSYTTSPAEIDNLEALGYYKDSDDNDVEMSIDISEDGTQYTFRFEYDLWVQMNREEVERDGNIVTYRSEFVLKFWNTCHNTESKVLSFDYYVKIDPNVEGEAIFGSNSITNEINCTTCLVETDFGATLAIHEDDTFTDLRTDLTYTLGDYLHASLTVSEDVNWVLDITGVKQIGENGLTWEDVFADATIEEFSNGSAHVTTRVLYSTGAYLIISGELVIPGNGRRLDETESFSVTIAINNGSSTTTDNNDSDDSGSTSEDNSNIAVIAILASVIGLGALVAGGFIAKKKMGKKNPSNGHQEVSQKDTEGQTVEKDDEKKKTEVNQI